MDIRLRMERRRDRDSHRQMDLLSETEMILTTALTAVLAAAAAVKNLSSFMIPSQLFAIKTHLKRIPV